MEPTSFQSPLPPPRSLDYELSNILTRLSECESYTSGWVSTLLRTTEALQSELDALKSENDALKEQKLTGGASLSFRQLIELHHLQIISKDEIRSLLRVPEALAETNQQWTSLFTFDSEPKSVSAGLSLVDVVPTTEAEPMVHYSEIGHFNQSDLDSLATDAVAQTEARQLQALDVLYPSPAEPDL